MINETVAKIKADLKSHTDGRYTVSCLDFSKLEIPLCESKCRHDGFAYDSRDETLRFTWPTFIHAGPAMWLQEWAETIKRRKMVKEHSLVVYHGVELYIFHGPFEGSKKNPKAGLWPRARAWPPIVVKVGYGESDEDLLNGTDILLEGSEGCVGYAIVVKLGTLAPGEREIQDGYVELHKYCKDTGRRVKVGSRMQLYPPPANHSQQCIEFSWYEISRNKKSDLCITEEAPPPMYLDELQTEINEGVEHHLKFENGELDDESDDEEML